MSVKHPPFYTQAYIDRGEGPAVILLHGLFGNIGMWRNVVTAFEDDYRVIIPRLPIFDLPASAMNIEYLAQVLHEFILWHELDDVTLVGHAQGGQVALKYAHLFPESVDRLVLTGCNGLNELLLNEEGDDYDSVYEKLQDVFYDHSRLTPAIVDKVYQTVQNTSKREVIKSLTRTSDENNVTSFLYKIEKPVLIVWGLQDKLTPPATAVHFHDTLTNAEIRFIDNCGHLPMVEYADLFNLYVTSFLEDSQKSKKIAN